MIEYKVVTLHNTDAAGTDDLNALAREGWYVVTCCYISGRGFRVILSRPTLSSDAAWVSARVTEE